MSIGLGRGLTEIERERGERDYVTYSYNNTAAASSSLLLI